MAFIDELHIRAQAGRGGDGVVRWRHEKGKEFAGAAGGDGGAGGSVYARAIRDIHILARYKTQKEFVAEDGEAGMRNSMHGRNGKDFIIDVPVGSVITNKNTGKSVYVLNEGEQVLLLQGGRGGLGNEYFKASTNVTPKQSTKGKDGESADFSIELELVADAGFIGLPNAGKSSLLNALTRANAKVADYAFTTLEPNLGDFYGFILADVPGLIEGASEGKGLGHKFLRHVKRTKMLFHCISLENEDIVKIYKIVRKELESFEPALLDKKEVIILTKTDMVDEKTLKKHITKAKKLSKDVFSVSVIDDTSIKSLADNLNKILKKESK